MAKQKPCPICKEPFTKQRMGQKTCMKYKCAIEHGRLERKKEFRKETRRLKEKTKARSDWFKDALKACKRYVRARDRVEALREGRNPHCCSCLTEKHDIQYAAGHFKTAGAHGELALNEFNIHLQCNRYCNKGLSGNIYGNKHTPGYLKFMVDKYGQDYVDSLEGRPVAKYTIDELKEIKTLYNYFANGLEKELKLLTGV